MNRESIYEINERSVTASAAVLNKLATEAQELARIGTIHDIAHYVTLADRAFVAQAREYGMRYWTRAGRERCDDVP